jgi:hypothetical protein
MSEDKECRAEFDEWVSMFPKMTKRGSVVGWEAWQAALSRAAKPAVPDDLIELLRELRPNYGDVGSRDVDVTERQRKIDAAIALLSAAPPRPVAQGVPEWQSIETAPRHKEVIVWREDSGPFIAKLTTPDAVITVEEMERERLEFPDDFEEWFSDAYGWQEGSEKPTHWMPLPAAPKEPTTDAGGEG